ncbi:hypothetical protein AWC38_SpisGene14279 [Stylophora pistillata]|uniref:Reverse transcriptase domain-containing protein n=1 Tax=Stylophora pistillata TaxID=50429 RepID=A0A2B4RYB7_STYPI|nr:hypothetical protein AWC38_SpisGene14279 [Stylophora pistillata]
MRRANTDTPMMLDFCLRFPRCINELLKRITGTSYRCFTNPMASYYLQPTLGDVDVNFCDIAKLPKPSSGCLTKKQLDELRQWTKQFGRSVWQNTTRNFSTKDKPGTLLLNLYESAPPEQHSVDFDVLLNEDIPAQQDTSTTHNVVITQSTYVVVSRMYKPRSAPNSPLYITKLLEDVVDDCDSAGCHQTSYHFYADDTQIYTTFNPSDALESKSLMEECIQDVQLWMVANKLKLNGDKTELLVLTARHCPQPPLDSSKIGADIIKASKSAKNIGVWLDGVLSMDEQINNICKTAFFHLRNIAKIRKFLSHRQCEILIHAFISSKLDYYNVLLSGLKQSQINRLQQPYPKKDAKESMKVFSQQSEMNKMGYKSCQVNIQDVELDDS